MLDGSDGSKDEPYLSAEAKEMVVGPPYGVAGIGNDVAKFRDELVLLVGFANANGVERDNAENALPVWCDAIAVAGDDRAWAAKWNSRFLVELLGIWDVPMDNLARNYWEPSVEQ